MVEEIEFENHHFLNFKSHVTCNDLESHIVVNVSSTLTNTTIWFVVAFSLIVDVCTDGQTDGHFTGFIRSSLRRSIMHGSDMVAAASHQFRYTTIHTNGWTDHKLAQKISK